jgi:hypothetical protein
MVANAKCGRFIYINLVLIYIIMQPSDDTHAKSMKIMQENHDSFIVNLLLLLETIKNEADYSNADKLLQEILSCEIDIEKKGSLIKKIFMLLDIYYDYLKSHDKKIFSLYSKQDGKIVKITVIPKVDIGSIWNKLSIESQDKIWLYLKYMYIHSSQMIDTSGNSNNVINTDKIATLRASLTKGQKELYEEFWNKFPDNKIVPKPTFNPYVGVGENKSDYSVNDILSGPKLLKDQVEPGIGGITYLLGLDKIINMEDLSNQLKNVTKEQIEEATKCIKSFLGDVDENTSDMLSLMLTDIKEELSKENATSAGNNPIESFFKIADSVAHRVLPKIDPKKVDMKKILNSTKNIANKCQDANGNPLFSGPNNPLSFLTGMIEREMNKPPGKRGKVMTDVDYAKECQNMMKDLGLPNLPIDQLKNLQLDKLIPKTQQDSVASPTISSNSDNISSKSKKSKTKHTHKRK